MNRRIFVSFTIALGITIAGTGLAPVADSAVQNDERLPAVAEEFAIPEPVDISEAVRQFQQIPLPEDEFQEGHTETPAEEDGELQPELTETEFGYVIQFDNFSPIPTPLVAGGRLYTGGGFSSTSFHCFDAHDGRHKWSIALSDDGPSTPVQEDNNLYFGTESCTIFGIAMEDGEHKWSWYLGDPLLSAPAAQGNRIVTVFPAADLPVEAIESLMAERQQNAKPEGSLEGQIIDLLEPTHVAVCFAADTGVTIWQHWIDSDCLTEPVIEGNDVFIVSLSGNFYHFRLDNGALERAIKLQATSAPLVTSDSVFLTQRISRPSQEPLAENGEPGAPDIREILVRLNRNTFETELLAAHEAPYLDPWVQALSDYTNNAGEFEKMNGWGGGGFGGGGGAGSSGGIFAMVDPAPSQQQQEGAGSQDGRPASEAELQEATEEVPGGIESSETELQVADGVEVLRGDPDYSVIDNLLGYTEVQAAENIGMGSVSTIQGYNGSRPVLFKGRLFSTMGDSVICASADDGAIIWEVGLQGDIKELGGHLGTVPVVHGNHLLVATYGGELLEFDPDTGAQSLIRSFEDTTFRFPPAVQGDLVFLTTQDGRLICVDLSRERARQEQPDDG